MKTIIGIIAVIIVASLFLLIREHFTDMPTTPTTTATPTTATQTCKYKISVVDNNTKTKHYVMNSGMFTTDENQANLFQKDSNGFYNVKNGEKYYFGVSNSSGYTTLGMYSGSSKNLMLNKHNKMQYTAKNTKGRITDYYVSYATNTTVSSNTNPVTEWKVEKIC